MMLRFSTVVNLHNRSLDRFLKEKRPTRQRSEWSGPRR
jgi:hypothetical protein